MQIKLARARVLIDSGRALSRNASIALQEMSARGEIPDIATKLRWRAQSAFAVNQAREAVETLWSCYGAQGLYTRDPLATPSARRDRDEPALLVQLRYRGRGLRPARARRQLRQSGDVMPRHTASAAPRADAPRAIVGGAAFSFSTAKPAAAL